MKLEAWAVGITAGSREVPRRNACDRRHTYCIIIIIIIISDRVHLMYYEVSRLRYSQFSSNKAWVSWQFSCRKGIYGICLSWCLIYIHSYLRCYTFSATEMQQMSSEHINTEASKVCSVYLNNSVTGFERIRVYIIVMDTVRVVKFLDLTNDF